MTTAADPASKLMFSLRARDAVVRNATHHVRPNPGRRSGLDRTFFALSDPTRRAILLRLMSGGATARELAQPFSLSQPAIWKHLKVLEDAQLLCRASGSNRVPRLLATGRLTEAMEWLAVFSSRLGA